MTSVVSRDPQFSVLLDLSRTVAKVDSIGLVARICTQCSAGKSLKASISSLSFAKQPIALGYLASKR